MVKQEMSYLILPNNPPPPQPIKKTFFDIPVVFTIRSHFIGIVYGNAVNKNK